MKRLFSSIGSIALLTVLLPAASSAQMGARPSSQAVTVHGTVIDLDCRFRNGLSGEEMHRMCAQVCADNGLPLAILGDDGKLYMPVGGGMPGDPQNPVLREYAEQQVTVTGNAFQAGGAIALQIESIERS